MAEKKAAAKKRADTLGKVGKAIKKWFWGTGTEGGLKGIRDGRASQKKKLKIMKKIEEK